MKNVLLRGPFLTLSGYGVHSRQIARWALQKEGWNVKIQATPWGITPWFLNDEGENGLIGKIMQKLAGATPAQSRVRCARSRDQLSDGTAQRRGELHGRHAKLERTYD